MAGVNEDESRAGCRGPLRWLRIGIVSGTALPLLGGYGCHRTVSPPKTPAPGTSAVNHFTAGVTTASAGTARATDPLNPENGGVYPLDWEDPEGRADRASVPAGAPAKWRRESVSRPRGHELPIAVALRSDGADRVRCGYYAVRFNLAPADVNSDPPPPGGSVRTEFSASKACEECLDPDQPCGTGGQTCQNPQRDG